MNWFIMLEETRNFCSYSKLTSKKYLVLWEYPLCVLKQINFGSKWIKWIQACVCSISFSVLINVRPTMHFQAGRGLCQGDPLSPLLFIIIAEVLARLMKNSIYQLAFHPFSLSKKTFISIFFNS